MSRIENKVPEPPPKSPPPPKADQNKSAEKGAFASKMQLKKPEGDAKTNTRTMSESAKSDKSDSSLGQSAISSEEQSPSTLLMQRHGSSVIDRRSGGGTVADLMAQLQQESQSKAQKLSGGELDTQASAAASANAQQIGSTGLSLENSATIQVQGTRIPNAMLDKIVDQARIGVNATGASEFQFDLKGDVLGGLKMRMSMDNGQLRAIFVAENPEIRRYIDGNLQDLQRTLQDRGIHIRDLEVRDPEEDRRQRQRDQHNKDREDSLE